jgi:hypothetical protein
LRGRRALIAFIGGYLREIPRHDVNGRSIGERLDNIRWKLARLHRRPFVFYGVLNHIGKVERLVEAFPER